MYRLSIESSDDLYAQNVNLVTICLGEDVYFL